MPNGVRYPIDFSGAFLIQELMMVRQAVVTRQFYTLSNKQEPGHVSGANYCNLPKYNSHIGGAAVSLQAQQQLIALCLVVWLCLFCR
jgi:hypothetical protein